MCSCESRNAQDAWEGWRAWHARRQAKAEIVAAHRGRIQAGCATRCVRAWNEAAVRRRLDLQVRASRVSLASAWTYLLQTRGADGLLSFPRLFNPQSFNEIAKVEVQRLRALAWSRLHLGWRRAQKVSYAKHRLAESCATRALRHWRALTHFRQQRRRRHDRALETASATRRARVVAAWRLAAATSAEHRRILRESQVRLSRRTAAKALTGLRQAVLEAAADKAKELSAALHWERRRRSMAMAGWRARTLHWRKKTVRWRRAQAHYRARLLDAAFAGWLLAWQEYQVRAERAGNQSAG